MGMRRLGWAGDEVECDGETLVIDYVQDTSPLAPVLRSPDEPFPAASRVGGTAGALLTHLHADHADPDALAAALRPGAPVFRPEATTGDADDRTLTSVAEEKFARHALATSVVGPWEHRSVGPFRVSTVPAVDGFGDPQHGWVVECGGRRVFHGGDTLFHGSWWRIARRFAPFDVAFLPVNAPVCEWPHLQPPSSLEAVMGPEEAAVAAHMLRARAAVPIHDGALHQVPAYVETPHPTERLSNKAKDFGLRVLVQAPGAWFEPD